MNLDVLPVPVLRNPNDDFRVDKNVARNIDAITGINYIAEYQLSTYDTKLLKNFLYYVFYTYERNIFNFRQLDPVDFAREYNYHIKNLIGKHPNPIQLRGKTQQEIEEIYLQQDLHPENRVYDSYLENILYFLVSQGVVFPRGYKTTEFSGEVTYTNEITSVKILDSVTAVYIKGKRGKERIVYHYELNPVITNNLISYYLRGSKKVLLELRSENLDDLYLYLKNLREDLFYKNQTLATPEFELLCSLAGIKKIKENGEAYEPKYRKRDLIKSLTRVQSVSDFEFTFEFVKGRSQKWAYSINIHYKPKFETASEQEENIIREKRLILSQSVYHELLEKYRSKYGQQHSFNSNENDFYNWVKNPSLDDEIKKLCFRSGYFKTYKKLPEFIESLERNFLKKLPTMNSIHDIIT